MGFGKNVGDALTFKNLTLGKRPQILHRSVIRSALDLKTQNKRVQFDKPLPVIEQRNQHKHPSKVIEVEEANPTLRPRHKKKVVNFVDESSQHVKFSEGPSPLTGTLIDLTKVDPKLAASFLEQLNISKISPNSSTAESTPKKQKKMDPTKLAYATVGGSKDV